VVVEEEARRHDSDNEAQEVRVTVPRLLPIFSLLSFPFVLLAPFVVILLFFFFLHV
jgi:hypothetical protein